jgi:multidrug transporter EmrE-like cation transporter
VVPEVTTSRLGEWPTRDEPASPARLLCLVAVVAGVAGLKLVH